MANGGWVETQGYLAMLSSALQQAVASGNETNVLNACRSILAWGGTRDWNKGAWPFLNSLARTNNLCCYLQTCEGALKLSTANCSSISPPVALMNSMLTKIHALYATDGLPIYDSRVAAAIATLVELWRQSSNLTATPLPAALSFKATEHSIRRTVLGRFPKAAHVPGVIQYGIRSSTGEWANSKVRLGWLMEEVLMRLPTLFANLASTTHLSSRMRAFEAALFMVGYDVNSIGCPSGNMAMPLVPAKCQAQRSSVVSSPKNSSSQGTTNLS